MDADVELRNEIDGLVGDALSAFKKMFNELEKGVADLLRRTMLADEQSKKDRENEELKQELQRLRSELREQGISFDDFMSQYGALGFDNMQQAIGELDEGQEYEALEEPEIDELGEEYDPIDLDDPEFDEGSTGALEEDLNLDELDAEINLEDLEQDIDLDNIGFDGPGFEQEIKDVPEFNIGGDDPEFNIDLPEPELG